VAGTLAGVHAVQFETVAVDGTARAGVAHTANGSYTTPLFMPVGTRGAIKYLSADDYAGSVRRSCSATRTT
jgi:queuine tRNA-ribosyltransferase